jgi:hypothetical protein
MFCDRCGQQLPQGSQFCSACGKPMSNASVVVTAARGPAGRLGQNLNVLGALWIADGALLLAGMAWIVFVGHAFVSSAAGDIAFGMSPFPGRFAMDHMISSGMLFVGFWLGLFGAINVIVGWGLVERQPWARVFCIILGFLALLRFPLGTALGIYTIWVLLPSPSGQEYDRLARSS